MASDGVWDALTDKEIVKVMKTEKEDAEFDYGKKEEAQDKVRKKMCKGLIESSTDSPYWSRNNANADNTTAIILFF